MRLALYILGFELVTFSAGIWGWASGVPFWPLLPASFLCGVGGGIFLSAGVHAIRTGTIERSGQYYRFWDRPLMFTLDSVLIVAAILLCTIWPIGYACQELAELRSHNQPAETRTP